MTITRTPITPQQLAECASVLELLLPHGHQLVRTRRGWLLQRWDSYIDHSGPRMGWLFVAQYNNLSALLGRLGERS